jgi:hypothetical protein
MLSPRSPETGFRGISVTGVSDRQFRTKEPHQTWRDLRLAQLVARLPAMGAPFPHRSDVGYLGILASITSLDTRG